jgi:signal transduction histidine kinase
MLAMNSAVVRYGVALVSLGVAVTLQQLLVPLVGNETPFLVCFAAVMFSSWFGGFGPGLLSTALSATAANYLFMAPRHQFSLSARPLTQTSIYILEAAFISALSEARRRSAARADSALKKHQRVEREVLLLVEASGALLTSLDPGEMLEKIVELASKFVSADAYAVWRRIRGTGAWQASASRGLSQGYRDAIIPASSSSSAMPETPTSIEDVNESPMLVHRRPLYASEGIRSLLVVPLRIHGESSGTLTFYYHQPHRATDSEIQVATALGNLAAAALGTADLYEDQRILRAQAEDAERRASFLAEASIILASSLDYETTLQSVARLAVPRFGDWCAIHLLDPDGQARAVAVAHIDPAKAEGAREYDRQFPPLPEDRHGVTQVIRSGRYEAVNDVPDALLIGTSRSPKQLHLLREIGMRAYLCVPLGARGRILGTLSFLIAGSDRRFGPQEIELAEELARRAAVAVDNAMLYRSEERGRQDAERTAELLRQSNEDLEQFAYVSSHDLQEPLRTIASYVQLLEQRYQGKLDSESERFAGFVVEGVDRMRRLLNDLLDYSRVAQPGEPMERTDAMECLRAALENLQASIEEVQAAVTHDALPAVKAHPQQLTRLFQNLVGNAVKFRGAEAPRVHISAERAGAEWTFAVRDNGAGFDPSYSRKIFVMFQRLHGRQHGGTGIGLAICKRIVERHGGRIWVDSEPGVGSTFRFTLPAVD